MQYTECIIILLFCLIILFGTSIFIAITIQKEQKRHNKEVEQILLGIRYNGYNIATKTDSFSQKDTE
jgi:preprotein translocase subunit YajC